jgi:hypothetical protein
MPLGGYPPPLHRPHYYYPFDSHLFITSAAPPYLRTANPCKSNPRTNPFSPTCNLLNCPFHSKLGAYLYSYFQTFQTIIAGYMGIYGHFSAILPIYCRCICMNLQNERDARPPVALVRCPCCSELSEVGVYAVGSDVFCPFMSFITGAGGAV